jgi:hypothetical protein
LLQRQHFETVISCLSKNQANCNKIYNKSFKSEKGLKIHNGRIHRAQKYFSTGNNKFEDIKSSTEEKLKKHPQILNINNHSKIYEGKQLLILLKENFANAKSHIKTIRRIPKGARYSAAVKLCTIIKECLDSNSITAWSNLLLFSYKVFNISEKSLKKISDIGYKRKCDKF